MLAADGVDSMDWFRRNARAATWFALLALAIHFTLTFGHLHGERLIKSTISQSAISIVSGPDSADASADALPAAHRTSHGLPAGPAKNSGSGDDCAICANINLAGSLLSPAAPLLAAPPNGHARPAGIFEFEPARPHRLGFDARGPPLT